MVSEAGPRLAALFPASSDGDEADQLIDAISRQSPKVEKFVVLDALAPDTAAAKLRKAGVTVVEVEHADFDLEEPALPAGELPPGIEVPQKAAVDTLLISADFFGYAREIVAELERRGRKVLHFDDRPGIDTMTKALARIHPMLVAKAMRRHCRRIIEVARANPIRDVLVIKGEALTVSMIKRLRAALPNVRFTLYFWDSYRNMPRDSAKKVGLFDRALSFDIEDVRADSRLSYRPLFFLPQFTTLPHVHQDLDLLFVGTIHTDRYRILRRLSYALPAGRKAEFHMYYPSRRLLAVRRLVDPAFSGSSEAEFVFTPLGRDQVTQLIARARIAIDIERSVQAGFTMRTIEMIGSNRKIVTTNPNVLKADFYRPNNIAVIDRLRPVVSEAFLEAPFEPLPPDLLYRYSLAGWLDEILPC
jgi:hypothetical protein